MIKRVGLRVGGKRFIFVGREAQPARVSLRKKAGKALGEGIQTAYLGFSIKIRELRALASCQASTACRLPWAVKNPKTPL